MQGDWKYTMEIDQNTILFNYVLRYGSTFKQVNNYNVFGIENYDSEDKHKKFTDNKLRTLRRFLR